MSSSRFRSFVAGMLVGNSAPHLATAITGRRHLTPLAGRDSGPGANAAWGMINLLSGLLLLSPDRHRAPASWNSDLLAFEAGVAAFATWQVVAERILRVTVRG
ncbi:hypothetical protein ACFQE5_12100 [Pseudonocardia hispaniensis]|uniref:Uncharacterized protein n=1 Tax=Pseudonocardia hispaniensis TaxID=904933 RepID=A0ABW1J2M7_9PSEU